MGKSQCNDFDFLSSSEKAIQKPPASSASNRVSGKKAFSKGHTSLLEERVLAVETCPVHARGGQENVIAVFFFFFSLILSGVCSPQNTSLHHTSPALPPEPKDSSRHLLQETCSGASQGKSTELCGHNSAAVMLPREEKRYKEAAQQPIPTVPLG